MLNKIPVQYHKLRDYTVGGQSNVWRLPKYWHPLTHLRVCTLRLWCGGRTHSRRRGGGVSIVLGRKTPDTALFSIYVSTLWYHIWAEHAWSPPWPFSEGWQHVRPYISLNKSFSLLHYTVFSFRKKCIWTQAKIANLLSPTLSCSKM